MAMTSVWITLHCVVVLLVTDLVQGLQYPNSTPLIPGLTDEQRLYRQLRRNYDPYTRPVYNASHVVVVTIGITLTQIFDLDEKNQVLTTNVWLDQEWRDEKLQWRPEDYNGLRVLRIPCKHIWKPDIVLYNSVEDYTDGYMQALAMVSYTGHVFWPPIVKFHSTCQIDITYFPFDDQLCTMKLGSWAYDGLQVDVVNRSRGVDLTNYVSNGEWQLLEVQAVRNTVYYSCCPEPFPDVRFLLYLRRRTLYYTYNVIIPCVMLSTLTLLVFWMSPESGEKITLGLTVLLAFSVFMLLIAENMPATSSNVPLIGIYLTSVMALTSISVTLAVVVSNISNRGRKDKVMPAFLVCFIRALAKIVCFRLHYVTAHVTSAGRGFHPVGPRFRPHVLYRGVENHVSNDSGCGLVDMDANSADFRCTKISTEQNSTAAGRLGSEFRREELRHKDGGQAPEAVSPPGGKNSSSSSSSSEDIVFRLRQLLLREEERDKGENLCRQWQEAAQVIDRCLFILFVVATLATTVTSLLILPLTKHRLQADVDIFKS